MAKGYSDTKTRILTYKSASYGVLLFIFAVAQVTFFTKINILGATPDILLASIVALAMFEEHKVSTICGIIAGFFYYALGGFTLPLYMIFSFFCGYVLWGVSAHAFGKNYPSFLALSALTFLAKALYNVLEASFLANSFNVFNVITKTVIPEFISSMLFCSIPYILLVLPINLLNKKSKRRVIYK